MSRLQGAGRPVRAARRGGLALAIALGCVALAPASALASRSEPTIFDAGTSLLAENPGARASDLRELAAIGTDTVRVVFPWRSLAPAPDSFNAPPDFDAANPSEYPAQQAQHLDQIVRGASRLGMDVLLTPSSPIPNWASASGESRLRDPLPSEFAEFVEALGHRYSGSFGKGIPQPENCPELLCPPASDESPLPRVGKWAIWNEPNLDTFLRPQFRGGRPFSPTLYRNLYLAGRDGLALSGHRSDDIYVGETAATGGSASINPLDFARGVLCMDPHFGPAGPCRPLQASGWSHHPYGYAVPPQLKPRNPAMINVAELGRLTSLLARAYEVGTTSRPLDVYLTEFGVLTPPSSIGVSPLHQVEQLAASEFLAWRDPHVLSWGQYLLRDDPPKYTVVFTTGLRYADDSPKPLRRAFPVTLLVRRVARHYVRIWGHVRPGSGQSSVEIWTRRRGRRPVFGRAIRTDRNGYFGFGSPYRRDLRWKAEAKLSSGRHLAGPFLPAMRFRLPY